MSSYKVRKTPGDTSWFTKDRFGMFIHFGLYSLAARHEWTKSREKMSEENYQRYFDHFNPDLFDAKKWAKQAKEAGMKYAVLTTKHHEGFCLFDTKYTDYKITNTAFKRDIVKEFVEAFRAEGLRVGFYYSLIDWHHPHFPIDPIHPRCLDENAEKLDKGRDMTKYAQYMRDQVTELMTNYGKIDILWFDFSYDYEWGAHHKEWMQFGGKKQKEQWESEKLIATARKYNPDVIINNRSGVDQDIWTPEQYQPEDWAKAENGDLVPWETCQTFSGVWGYARDEFTWKSPEMLINMLVNTVSQGGNLIMNVGPTARGEFDYRAINALNEFSQWMHFNSRSIYNCTKAEPEFVAPEGCKLTQSEDGKRLYIHLQTYPFKRLFVKNLAGKVEYAQFLSDASEITFSDKINVKYANSFSYKDQIDSASTEVAFNLPPVKPHGIAPVIEVFLR